MSHIFMKNESTTQNSCCMIQQYEEFCVFIWKLQTLDFVCNFKSMNEFVPAHVKVMQF